MAIIYKSVFNNDSFILNFYFKLRLPCNLITYKQNALKFIYLSLGGVRPYAFILNASNFLIILNKLFPTISGMHLIKLKSCLNVLLDQNKKSNITFT